jgi:hypothetical protein
MISTRPRFWQIGCVLQRIASGIGDEFSPEIDTDLVVGPLQGGPSRTLISIRCFVISVVSADVGDFAANPS